MKKSDLPAKILGYILVLSLGIALLWATSDLIFKAPNRQNKVAVEKTIPNEKTLTKNKLQKTCRDYLKSLNPVKDWWMVETPMPSESLADTLSTIIGKLEDALDSARSVSSLTEEIADRFSGNFYTSIFENGISRITARGQIDMDSFKGRIEVCFFSKRERAENNLSLLSYREDWKALMIGGVRWQKPFFSAVLMHELGHALNHSKGKSSSPPNEEWYKEEIAMHELEALILDRLTNGKYFSEIESILKTYSSVLSAEEFLGQLSTNDLAKLDSSIGLEENGSDIRGVSLAQNLIAVGFRFLEKKNKGLEDKVLLYKNILKLSL